MMEHKGIVVFESKHVRRVWHNEKWYFSVVDVCGALTDSPNAGAYWRKLKQRLNQEGSEIVTFCHGLKTRLKKEKSEPTTICSQLKM
jgi:prophage antirepressor-like protein